MTGPELRALRKRLGLTQALFAQTLGISVSKLIDYERGYDRHPIKGSDPLQYNPCPVPRLVELACMAPAQELMALKPERRPRQKKRIEKVRVDHFSY